MEEVVENPSENITKLVINNQTKTELRRSPPIKTYSKKLPESCDSPNESRSRYGRERKSNACSDFLSTDHRLGQYLKQETVKEAFFKKDSKKYQVKEKRDKDSPPSKRGRGRPRKSLSDLNEVKTEPDDKDVLNKSLPAIDIATDYQAPVPTSTETLPLPTELKGVKVESDMEEDVEDSDWNCGDLCWAAVPSYPYWPCSVTRDPVDGTFIKQATVGRSVKPQTLLHVRFFGDNGRRSWVKASNLMSFNGLDDYQTLVEQICTPQLKKADVRKYKMFTVAPSQRKAWQAAVSEAESLLASPRSERILYFENLYPSAFPVKAEVDAETPTNGKKRKMEEMVTSYSLPVIPVIEKKVKLDCNRYSIDLETLALQAAPITPRAIYAKNQTAYTVSKRGPTPKRPYVKKSEWWLNCKNKLMTGIVAGMEPNVNLGQMKNLSKSAQDLRTEEKVKKIILNGSCDSIKVEMEDDFAVPPAADLPLAPSSVVQKADSATELSKDVTSMEFQTVKDVTTVEFRPDENPGEAMGDGEVTTSGICESPAVDTMQNISIMELSPVETTQISTVEKPFESSSVIAKPSVTPKARQVGQNRKVSSKSVPKSPDITSPDTPGAKKRGRPRKYPVDSNPPKKETPVKKLPNSAKKTDINKSITPRISSRPRAKSEKCTPEIKRDKIKTPKSKIPVSKTPVKKTKKSPTVQDDTLEIRKFGYKGSKVFKKFLEMNFDKIVDERPDLSVKDIEKYIEDLWLRKTDAARQKFKSRLEAEATEEFVVDKTVADKAETPLALPSIAKSATSQVKKVPSIFYGIKDRVCQMCLKGDNLLRCKGPCAGYYHKECGDCRQPIKSNDDIGNDKKKRGRKKSSVGCEDPITIKSVLNRDNVKTEFNDEPDKCQLSNDGCKTISDVKMEIDENHVDDIAMETDESGVKPTESDKDVKPCTDDHVSSANLNYRDDNKNTDEEIKNGSGEKESDGDGSEAPETKVKLAEDLMCEKENVLPTDSDNKNNKITRIKSADRAGVKTSPAHVSKSESVSSEDSNKSEDCKSENSDKCDSLKNSDSETDSKKMAAKTVKQKGKSKKANESESDNVKNGSTWKCLMCRENVEDTCFICRKEKPEKIHRCCISSCGLFYHLSCCEGWPQTHTQAGSKGRTVVTCPQHTCHTCISDNPKANIPKYNIDKLVKCLYCPTSYHHSNYCVPAGSEILSNSQIICPRHYEGSSSKLHHVNAAWCFICSVGGSLICCDLCPNSFHVECLKIPSPEGSFICEDCETGRYPLFGEIVWVKLGAYRWWPAKILFPSEIPINIKQLPHKRGEFAIKFFGSHDHYWINRGRVFLYHEGDGEAVATKSRVDKIFNQAMLEARESYTAFASERDEREAISKFVLKPPKYIKINKNVCQNNKLTSLLKPVEGYVDNLTPCECKPEQESPCGPNSDCINRLLMIECNPQVCPAKDKCRNQNFEKRLYPSLSPFMTDNRGWGLKTNEPIKKGDFIIEYVGEIIDEEEYDKRLREMQKKKNENYYFLTVDKDMMLDAGPKGNVARFMNHSCDPNCETQKWTVNGVTRVGLFALLDIAKDAELVFNYQLETISNTKVACKCGAKSCTGFIGGDKSINKSQSNGESSRKTDTDKKKTKEAKKVKRAKSTSSKVMNDFCFTCSEGGALLLCDAPNCPNSYHLSCLGLSKEPIGEWMCPVHQCSVCSHPKVKRCALCINSYCSKHTEGNIIKHKVHGLVCTNHAFSDTGSEGGVDPDSKSTALSNGTQKSIAANPTETESTKNTLSSANLPPVDPDGPLSTESSLINGHGPS